MQPRDLTEGATVQNFIRDENIKLYRNALLLSTDGDQRRVLLVLLQLLIAEEAALMALSGEPKPANTLTH